VIPFLLTRWKAVAAFALLLGFAWAWQGWTTEKALRKADRAAYVAAQAEATVIAQRALEATEAEYRSKADEADKAFQSKLADSRRAADAYVSAHRVRSQAVARDASGTLASAESGRASVPASLPTDAVLVSESDVQACTDAVTYGIEAHDWALTLPK